jgi:hypothetical protein
MGGNGSRWRGSKRAVVEDCLVLSIHDLIRQGAIVPGYFRRGLWTWAYDDAADEPHATICYEGDLRSQTSAWLRLQFTDDDGPVDQYVWLTTTKPHYGGSRWWFRCPSLNIRASKLYLPPAARAFASRLAHRLSYKSCQRSGTLDRLWRLAARETEGTERSPSTEAVANFQSVGRRGSLTEAEVSQLRRARPGR